MSTQAEYAERAELARSELASVLGSAPSPEAEAKAKALLERLGGSAAHGRGARARTDSPVKALPYAIRLPYNTLTRALSSQPSPSSK